MNLPESIKPNGVESPIVNSQLKVNNCNDTHCKFCNTKLQSSYYTDKKVCFASLECYTYYRTH